MSDHELLLESIARLEQALANERDRSDEAEAMLLGLRCISEAEELDSAESSLLSGFKPLFGYQASALLRLDAADPTVLTSVAADHPSLSGRRLSVGALLRRVLAGQPVALFDIQRAPDLAILAEIPGIRSALCVPLLTNDRPAVLLGTHPHPAFFSPKHVSLAHRVARMATRLLDHRAAREQAHHRRIAEERAARLAREIEAAESTRMLLEERVRERTADIEAKNQKLAEALETLQRTQEQLIQAEKMASLGLLVAGIAHEIKNPLNFVNNFAELSLEYVDEIEALVLPSADASIGPTLREVLDDLTANLRRIREHGRRADTTISTMLMHARERRGEPIALDVNGMLVEYTNLAYHGFRAADRAFVAELVTHLDPSIGAVPGPFQELGRVVVNLVSNACHAMRQRQRSGEPGYRAVLQVSSRRLEDRIELTVADNGTGLAPEAARRLFDPFFTTKPPGEGTGLGLSLSYEIVVKDLGGAIDVTSSPGEGATFTVRVPLVDRQAERRG